MKRRRRRALLVVLAGVPVLAVPAAGAQARVKACSSAYAQPSKADVSKARRATLCLLNRERARRGMRPLRLDGRLTAAATGHSRSMVRQHYFSHGNFVARIFNSRYVRPNQAWSLAENIAWGTDYLASPAQTVRAWMHSPPHRANILNGRFRDIGIGIAPGVPARVGRPTAAATYTTDFGAKG